MHTTKLSTLQAEGYVNIPYPRRLRAAVEAAVASWERFCGLPEAIRKRVPYSSQGNGVGYELKDGKGASADRKANFDYTSGGSAEIAAIAGDLKIPELSAFVEDLERLHALIAPEIIVFASDIEREFGLDGFAERILASRQLYFLRFIHYPAGRQQGDEIAVPHPDNSCFTFHLYESDGGLERLSFDRKCPNH
jgi:hypothetical protein